MCNVLTYLPRMLFVICENVECYDLFVMTYELVECYDLFAENVILNLFAENVMNKPQGHFGGNLHLIIVKT